VIWGAYWWEVRKLLRQKRTLAAVGAAILYALAFVVTLRLKADAALPPDIRMGSQVKHTAAALPLALLAFATFFGAPIVASLVPGDIVASEDSNNTLKMILTRSSGRGTIYLAKILASATYAVALVLVLLATALAGSIIAFGVHRAHLLDGRSVSGLHALLLTAGAYGAYLLPVAVLASIALFLSTATRNAPAAIIGTVFVSLVFQGVAALPGLEHERPYLLPSQFTAWQSLFGDSGSIARAAVVCAAYSALPLIAGWIIFRRRDVAGF
jgi:ABC-2 type transport system permease protein